MLGHGWGQTNLGHAYFNGRGLVVNKIYAYVWSDLGAWNRNDTGAKTEISIYSQCQIVGSQSQRNSLQNVLGRIMLTVFNQLNFPKSTPNVYRWQLLLLV